MIVVDEWEFQQFLMLRAAVTVSILRAMLALLSIFSKTQKWRRLQWADLKVDTIPSSKRCKWLIIFWDKNLTVTMHLVGSPARLPWAEQLLVANKNFLPAFLLIEASKQVN